MKLAILNSNIEATLIALQALTEASLSDLDKRLVGSDLYVYHKLDKSGEFQPNDASENKGWWQKLNGKKSQIIYIVDDAYDFVTNNATDSTSVENLVISNNKFNDYAVLQQEMKALVLVASWVSLTNSEKDIVITYNAHDDGNDKVTHLVSVHGMSVPEASLYLLEGWRKHHLNFLSSLEKRWEYVPVIALKHLNISDAEELFDVIKDLHYSMITIGRLGKDYGNTYDGIMDYVLSTNAYVSNGLKSSGYVLNEGTWTSFETELKDCIVNGIYNKL